MPWVNGDCFATALNLAVRTGGLVVHGVPVGRGPFNNGRRYAHAWVEHNGLVLDYASKRRIRLPKTVYYRKGKLEECHVRRYTAEKALALALDHEHVGPWDKGLEELEEI